MVHFASSFHWAKVNTSASCLQEKFDCFAKWFPIRTGKHAANRSCDASTLRTGLPRVIENLQEVGIYMSIHPDDPAFPIFGVPRILSNAGDVAQLFSEVPSPNCGLTMCTGSFGSCIDNNPAQMFEQFAARIYFVHFRNVAHVPGEDRSFYESNHLFGSVEMPRAMKALIAEEERRKAQGIKEWGIPMRPDHGKLMDGDIDSGSYPGYSRTGRMIGLAELRGLECGIRYSMGLEIL